MPVCTICDGKIEAGETVERIVVQDVTVHAEEDLVHLEVTRVYRHKECQEKALEALREDVEEVIGDLDEETEPKQPDARTIPVGSD